MERTLFHRRTTAAAVHLAISCAVAALAGALVFGAWYPGIYREVSGGTQLFALVTTVDVILGPLLTFTVFDVRKTRRHLATDLTMIGILQLGALVYGLVTVYQARPIAMVFEADRFRVVNASQVVVDELHLAPRHLQSLPLTGPWLLGTRLPKLGEERNEALFMGLRGIDVGQRPKFWQAYELSRAEVLAKSRPLTTLLTRHPDLRPSVQEALAAQKLDAAAVRFIPLTGARTGDWVVLLDERGRPVHQAPADGFF